MFRVTACDAGHIADIGVIHADQIIVSVVILSGHLYGTMRNNRYSYGTQLTYCAVMRAVADFFTAGGCGSDLELMF